MHADKLVKWMKYFRRKRVIPLVFSYIFKSGPFLTHLPSWQFYIVPLLEEIMGILV